jgi:hypothetical protein
MNALCDAYVVQNNVSECEGVASLQQSMLLECLHSFEIS